MEGLRQRSERIADMAKANLAQDEHFPLEEGWICNPTPVLADSGSEVHTLRDQRLGSENSKAKGQSLAKSAVILARSETFARGVVCLPHLRKAAAVWSLPPAQRIEARSDETPKAVQPEGREPGPKDAPKLEGSNRHAQ